MFVILTYDVEVKRNSKILKICRKYLCHVQKSVFEGHITTGKLNALKTQIQKNIDVEKDQVAIYRVGKDNKIEKEVLGLYFMESNIL